MGIMAKEDLVNFEKSQIIYNVLVNVLILEAIINDHIFLRLRVRHTHTG